MTKTIEIRDIKDRDYTRRGQRYEGRTYKGQHADIVPGKSIRLFGTDPNYRIEPKPHDITFNVGDTCVTDSYNFVYTGTITAITAKTVTVRDEFGRTKRMDIAYFNGFNAHYNWDRIAERNLDTMMHI